MPNALLSLAREYPGLFAVLAMVGVAGITTMALDYRGARKARKSDEEILADRRRAAIRKANQWYERDNEPRFHWWQ